MSLFQNIWLSFGKHCLPTVGKEKTCGRLQESIFDVCKKTCRIWGTRFVYFVGEDTLGFWGKIVLACGNKMIVDFCNCLTILLEVFFWTLEG